jgi:hypothetical protein
MVWQIDFKQMVWLNHAALRKSTQNVLRAYSSNSAMQVDLLWIFVQQVVQQIHNKSTSNPQQSTTNPQFSDKSTTNPQHLDMSKLCGFLVEIRNESKCPQQVEKLYNKSTTNRTSGA